MKIMRRNVRLVMEKLKRRVSTHRISAIRSSTAYHPRGPYATPRHQTQRSFGATYACAWRWSFTGIQESLNGGVINPTLKLVACWGSRGVEELRGGDWTRVDVDDVDELFAVIGEGVGVGRGDGG